MKSFISPPWLVNGLAYIEAGDQKMRQVKSLQIRCLFYEGNFRHPNKVYLQPFGGLVRAVSFLITFQAEDQLLEQQRRLGLWSRKGRHGGLAHDGGIRITRRNLLQPSLGQGKNERG